MGTQLRAPPRHRRDVHTGAITYHGARRLRRPEMRELPQRPTRQNSRDVPVHARGRDLRDDRYRVGAEHLHASRQQSPTPSTPSHYGDAAAQRRTRVESRAVWKSTSVSGAQFFTKSFLGDDAAVLARSSGEEPASPRHRAGIASMAWRTTRRFSTNAP